MKKFTAADLSMGAVFVGLMAIGANIAVWFPFLAIPIGGVSVPLSLQTFFAILAGLLLGKKLGLFTMFTYIMIGFAGVPVFANMKSGPFILFDYTGGFLLSFLAVAFITGWIAEKMERPKLLPLAGASFAGVIANYLIGVSYMYVAMNTWLGLQISYQAAWLGMVPFLIKDTGLTIVSAALMLKITNSMQHRSTSFSSTPRRWT
ncbi:biotin transporter BioY [Sediminibacillus halophilus]|uniref:Biotin transporter n=1 Tax=Sediminibacillus halophilus TaxID=482461 RepID=A0A1G9QR15_9BACI|nr:biotin transporter BioY [Sediminibacillus halophilus]SDM13413.1 biotin transport system substrate-specific component [Sediminibacillus halophilus]